MKTVHTGSPIGWSAFNKRIASRLTCVYSSRGGCGASFVLDGDEWSTGPRDLDGRHALSPAGEELWRCFRPWAARRWSSPQVRTYNADFDAAALGS